MIARYVVMLGFMLLAAFPALALEWMTDFPAALAKAKAEQKSVLLNFTGSDWCGWCIRLRNEVFATPVFAEYAKANLVCVEIDFPRRKKISDATREQNERLSQRFGVIGYPTIFLLNAEGETIGQTGYQAGGAEAFIKHLDTLIRPVVETTPAEATP